MKIKNCPSCLKPGYDKFCKPCQKKLFDNKKVDPVLTFSKPFYEQKVIEQAGRISISGVQPKHSVRLKGNVLELTDEGGEYIIKPHPIAIMNNVNQVPANEHLTMQIASQVFKLNIAVNSIMFFEETYEPCYITKRFDRKPDGSKHIVEDFAQIAGTTQEKDGAEYKYNLSYEEITDVLKKVCTAYPVEIEKLFRVIIFNFLVNNGDAHLKNFSMVRYNSFGDYLFSPFYDLLNTRIHFPRESELAVGLFKGGYETNSYKVNAHFLYEDFHEFGLKIGIRKTRVKKFLSDIISKYKGIEHLTNNSFLNSETKKFYLEHIGSGIAKLTPIKSF